MAKKLQRVQVGPNVTRRYLEEVQQILMDIPVRATTKDFPLQKPLPMPAPNHLPLEIVQSILKKVQYQPCVIKRRFEEKTYHAFSNWLGRKAPSLSVTALYLATTPLPLRLASASRITIQIRSTGRNGAYMMVGSGAYDNSHNCFEVSILRPAYWTPWVTQWGPLERLMPMGFTSLEDTKEALQDRGWDMVQYKGKYTWMVPRNRTKSSEWDNYLVDWRADEPDDPANTQHCEERHAHYGKEYLSLLRPGDKIAVWVRAEGWSWDIKVAEALIELSYEEK